MKIYRGNSIVNKTTVGNMFFYKKSTKEIQEVNSPIPSEEIQKLEKAINQSRIQLTSLVEKAKKEVGDKEAMIFEVHLMMLDEEDFCTNIVSKITEKKYSAVKAVNESVTEICKLFSDMDNDYFREREADIRDVGKRIIDNIVGNDEKIVLEEPCIIVAENLSPSETIQMDRGKILGFVTKNGSNNSHTAILAKTMNIPAIYGVTIDPGWQGNTAILDGVKGNVIINPSDKQLRQAKEQMQMELEFEEHKKLLKGKKTETKSGIKVELCANIGNVEDVDVAIDNDAEGIGLFRSEFIYLKSVSFPTEEEQFAIYKAVAEKMEGKRVIVRTLDIGADKKVEYFNLEEEENPALGYRAIRICLKQKDIFKTQLRAILRASCFGKIAVMFPMITSVWEIEECKKILEEAKKEMSGTNQKIGDVELGIMIETPAAALISRDLAKHVDFFSIGTNDLSQYTLAIDRQNPKLDTYFDPHHPAILRLIRETIINAHEQGIWVGICGELASDLELTEEFIEMGVDELSVSPHLVLPVREKIRQQK